MISNAFRYNAGLIRANGAPFFTGDGSTSSATLLDRHGNPISSDKLKRVDAIHRTDWQGRQLLYPTARKNFIGGSSTFSSPTYWTLDTGSTASATGGTAPNGETMSVLTKTGSVDSRISPVVSDTFSSAFTRYISVLILKDSVTTRFPELGIQFNGGTTQGIAVQLNTQTGATGLRAKVGTGGFRVDDYGTLWRLTVWLSALSSNTSVVPFFRAAAGTVLGVFNAAATGSITAFGGQYSDVDGSYIATTSGAVTVTDYTLTGSNVAFGQIPASGAVCDWTGVARR